MKKFISILLMICILSFSLFGLTGCYDATQIETWSYAIAMGIDEGENNVLKLSLQFALNTSSGDDGTSQSSDSTIISVDCSSISSGINLINSHVSKKVNLSHCKAIIISESLAVTGISKHIYTLMNDIQIRPDCNVLVSKCDAKIFLENSKSEIEPFSARYYETVVATAKYTGLSSNVYLANFFSSYKDNSSQGYAILCGLNPKATNTSKTITDNFVNVDNSYVASESPITGNNDAQYMGLAVFNGDKLVGELNGIESICHLITTGKIGNCVISIANPMKENENISIRLSKRKNTKKDVKMVNGSPFISLTAYLKGSIISMSEGEDLSKEEDLVAIQSYVNSYLEENILSYLYKTSKDLNSDIAGFGKNIYKNYMTIQDFNSLDWLGSYKNAFFNCNVECNIESGFILLKG